MPQPQRGKLNPGPRRPSAQSDDSERPCRVWIYGLFAVPPLIGLRFAAFPGATILLRGALRP